MKIHVGSKNQVKINAVADAIKLYPNLFPKPEILGIDVQIELFGHPKSIEETVRGAIERAKKAYGDCDYSFGLEGGLMKVPLSKSGFMEVGVCAIYDGKQIHLGLSPAFEWPKRVTNLIRSNKADASQALKQLRLTWHEKVGAVEGGMIGVLTQGRITRENYTKYSIIMALIHLENSDLF